MRWVASGRCGAVLLLIGALLLRPVRAADIPVIPWQSAEAYVGERVTMEGDVVRAEVANGALLMSFAPDDPRAARVLLVIPMFSDLPRKPESLYLGKRIRATGTLKRLGAGAPEMILRTPEMIEVVDVAGAPAAEPPAAAAPAVPVAPTAAASAPSAPAAVPTAPPPAGADAAVPARPAAPPAPVASTPVPAAPPAPVAVAPATPPAPAAVTPTTPAAPATATAPVAPAAAPAAPVAPAPAAAAAPAPAAEADDEVEAPTLELPQRDLCTPARTRWQEAAARLRERVQALDRCLAAGEPRCREAAAAVAPALTDLEWAEQHVADLCP